MLLEVADSDTCMRLEMLDARYVRALQFLFLLFFFFCRNAFHVIDTTRCEEIEERKNGVELMASLKLAHTRLSRPRPRPRPLSRWTLG